MATQQRAAALLRTHSQRLDLLALLLLHALRRYGSASPPVTYVEFSVGAGDLARPCVFDVLRSFGDGHRGSFCGLIEHGFPWLRHPPSNIAYKFLAGFDRCKTKLIPEAYARRGVELLYENPHLAIHATLKELGATETLMFAKHEEQLAKLPKGPAFYHWIVGLDLNGDELGYPYCPFVTATFLQFMKGARAANHCFGIRLHGAENVPIVRPELPGHRMTVAHMYIIFRSVEFLHRQLTDGDARRWGGIRMGHGIAFVPLLQLPSSQKRKSDVLLAEIKEMARFLFPYLPFELNLTSNYYLLGDSIRRDAGHHSGGGTDVIGVLQSYGAPILLSTDDDGVWPIDSCPHKHHQHHSLAAEYCKAITSKLVRTEQTLRQMLDNGRRYRFWDGSLKPVAPLRISNQRFAHQMAIVLHPRLVRFVLDRAADLSSPPGPFVDLYRHLYFSDARQRRTEGAADLLEPEIEPFAKIALAAIYFCRSWPEDQYLKESASLFPGGRTKKNASVIYDRVKHIVSGLMQPKSHSGARVTISIDGVGGKTDYLFCSAPPTATPSAAARFLKVEASTFLTSTMQTVKEAGTPARALVIHGFLIHDLSQESTDALVQECQLQSLRPENNRYVSKFKVALHSNRDKLQYRDSGSLSPGVRLTVNGLPHCRTDPRDEQQQHWLYAVCHHASVATAALHFLATHLPEAMGSKGQREKAGKLTVDEGQMDAFAFVPFLPRSEARGDSTGRKLEDDAADRPQMDMESVLKRYAPDHICEAVLHSILRFVASSNTHFWRPNTFATLASSPGVNEFLAGLVNNTDVVLPAVKVPGRQEWLLCTSGRTFASSGTDLATVLWTSVPDSDDPFAPPKMPWITCLLASNRLYDIDPSTWCALVMKTVLVAKEQHWRYSNIERWARLVRAFLGQQKQRGILGEFLRKDDIHLQRFRFAITDDNPYALGNSWQTDELRVNHPDAWELQSEFLDSLKKPSARGQQRRS